ncbi:unnamed protein product [Zymoseptoria tritici ST99CH_3D7]|uniref:Uncharacterized protein n=1 Tax=Zymoseptoria tritici (strain ST99CH_3D7) TaxID=1276538 RepID=A0A1X7RTP6_ZYMT9|nr:unnamed protein product [Zymoseptoria tritici ST99CH_3D7]
MKTVHHYFVQLPNSASAKFVDFTSPVSTTLKASQQSHKRNLLSIEVLQASVSFELVVVIFLQHGNGFSGMLDALWCVEPKSEEHVGVGAVEDRAVFVLLQAQARKPSPHLRLWKRDS